MKRTSKFMFLMLVVCLMLPNVSSAQGNWANFQPPQVTIDNKAGSHQGVALYTQLCQANGFNSIEDFVQNCCLTMAKTIYYSVEEANAHGLRSITYKLNDGGSLSYKGGAPPHIEVGFDVNHIVKFVNDYGNDAAITEVLGVLCHELTHGYQKEPKNAGEYDGNSEFFGEIEGIADLGRLLTGGFKPERFPNQGGSFKQGYTTTAFFYLWLSRTQAAIEGNFIRDLNLTAQSMGTWSHEAMCQQLFGKSMITLWNQYQQEISNYPWNGGGIAAVADFTTNSTNIQKGQSVRFTNLSKNAVSYEWTFEGGSPSTSTEASPVVTYNNEGNFRVTLVAYGSNTADTEIKDNYISVGSLGNDLVDITDLQGNISAQYSDSPANEGIEKLIDNSENSKYLTFHGTAWVQYEAAKAYVLSSYSITSGGDAPARDPKDWILKGSNNGQNWTTIDARTNQYFPSRNQKRTFTVVGVTAYSYYRLEMAHNGTDSSGSTILQLSEWELFGTESANPVELVNIIANCGDASSQYNDSPSNEDIANLTDGSVYSKYLTFHASAWVQVNACQQYVVNKYAISSANDAAERDPMNWMLKGSVDGNNWTTLDSRSNVDFPNRNQRREFIINNSQAVRYYRLEMNNNSGSILQLAELELFGYAALVSSKMKTTSLHEDRKPLIAAELEVRVWPNPADDYVTVYFSEEVKGSIQLFASSGSLVASIDKFAGQSERINVNQFPAGIYVVVIRTDKGVLNHKIVVE